MRFPREHWPKIRSTNPLERVDREIARRSDVVGISPNDEALLRLAAGVLVEINDEWSVAHRYLSQVSMARINGDDHGPSGPVGAGQPALEGALAGAGRSTTYRDLTCAGRTGQGQPPVGSRRRGPIGRAGGSRPRRGGRAFPG